MAPAPDSPRESVFGFDSAFLQKLERLALLSRRPLPGATAGPRSSPRKGSSTEWTDFREYAPGDEFRRIDWNAFARLDRLFVRLYSAEETANLTLFLDHSSSMDFGQPKKSWAVARFAAAIAYIALHNFDRVALAGWGEKVDHAMAMRSSKAVIPVVWRAIADLMSRPAGETDFRALKEYAAYHPGPGLRIIFSDFLTDSDWRSALRALRAGGQEVSVIQVLAPEEIDPSLRGDWKLRDVESNAEIEVTLSPRLLSVYKANLEEHLTAIRDFCHRNGMPFLQIASDAPLSETVLRDFRKIGVLR